MRDEILKGDLPYPGTRLLDKYPEQEGTIIAFWKALWYNFLRREKANGVHWYDELGAKVYNELMRSGCHNGWLISESVPARRWATAELKEDKILEFVSPDELQEIRNKFQYKKYLLECREAKASTLVRQNGKTKRTGLVRTGFRDAGNTQFGYDMTALERYEDAVKLNLTKSMDKIRSQYPEMRSTDDCYDKIVVGIYEWHCGNRYETFTTGDNINDSRGRAISQGLRKVFNPISSKDARAALLITYED